MRIRIKETSQSESKKKKKKRKEPKLSRNNNRTSGQNIHRTRYYCKEKRRTHIYAPDKNQSPPFNFGSLPLILLNLVDINRNFGRK
jgi:translation initiation factor 2 beta subunit (eIF-2beta)/eIF-5